MYSQIFPTCQLDKEQCRIIMFITLSSVIIPIFKLLSVALFLSGSLACHISSRYRTFDTFLSLSIAMLLSNFGGGTR